MMQGMLQLFQLSLRAAPGQGGGKGAAAPPLACRLCNTARFLQI